MITSPKVNFVELYPVQEESKSIQPFIQLTGKKISLRNEKQKLRTQQRDWYCTVQGMGSVPAMGDAIVKCPQISKWPILRDVWVVVLTVLSFDM